MVDEIEVDGLFDGVHFDLALAHPMDICSALVSDLLNVTPIVYSPGAFLGSDTYGYHSAVPVLSSYMPHAVTDASDRMTFDKRLKNTLFSMLVNSNQMLGEYMSPLRQQVIIDGC
jgi:hypothetical protein